MDLLQRMMALLRQTPGNMEGKARLPTSVTRIGTDTLFRKLPIILQLSSATPRGLLLVS